MVRLCHDLKRVRACRNLYTVNELPDSECSLQSFRFTPEGAALLLIAVRTSI
jgi:hypothetical protein